MHIPRAVCFADKQEMTVARNGTIIETLQKGAQSYYKVAADEYTCKECGNVVLLPAAQPIAVHVESNYAAIPAALKVQL